MTTVDTTSVRGKVMCGYQGWFRCPGDAANLGWIHWSRDSRRIAPDLLTFEMWPDMTDYLPAERYPAPGFTYPGGRQAELFSSDDARTVLRHFEWMRDYGIDGAWLQHFLVGLPGGPEAAAYPSPASGARTRPGGGAADGPGLGAVLRYRRHAAGADLRRAHLGLEEHGGREGGG
jgi:hypothetical protein